MKYIVIIIIFLILINSCFLFAQEQSDRSIVRVKSDITKKVALIIGNSNYIYGKQLLNPANDAKAMKESLERLAFEVYEYENCDQKTMKKAIDDFGIKVKNYNVGLFFYAGHGVQVDGNNYLVPIDAKLDSEKDVEYDCVRADRILAKMESAGIKTNIVILDACRDNPFERSWKRGIRGIGLAFMDAPSGSIIAYATSPGKTASDGKDNNGLYTSGLLEHLKTPNIRIEEMFKRVRETVINKSGGQQTPWESTSLRGDFFFNLTDINISNKINMPSHENVLSSLPFVIIESFTNKTIEYITVSPVMPLQYSGHLSFSDILGEALNGKADINNDGFILGRELGAFLCQNFREGKVIYQVANTPYYEKGSMIFTKEKEMYKKSNAFIVITDEYLNSKDLKNIKGLKSKVNAIIFLLENYGFKVTIVLNPQHSELVIKFNKFIEDYGEDKDNRLLFIFSGHSLKINNETHIIPSDFDNKTNTKVTLSESSIFSSIQKTQAKHIFLIFNTLFGERIFHSR